MAKKKSLKQVASKKQVKKKTGKSEKPISQNKRTLSKKSAANNKTSANKKSSSKKKASKLTELTQVALATQPRRRSEMQRLEVKLRRWLEQKKQVVLTWDCGGDETLVNAAVGGRDWSDGEFDTLCEILIEELQLPNAGEEFNSGGGTVELNHGQVIIHYKAEYCGVGYDMETEEVFEIPAENRQGKLLLFK